MSDNILKKTEDQKINKKRKLILSQRQVPKNDNIGLEDPTEINDEIKQTKNISNVLPNEQNEKPSQNLTFGEDEFEIFQQYFESIKKDNSILDFTTIVDYVASQRFCDLYEDVRLPPRSRFDDLQNSRPPELKGHNPDILYAAPGLKIETSSVKGRYLIATTQLERNEVLVSEKATVLQVNPLCSCDGDEFKQYRCHYCAVVCFKFYPCNFCNIVTYCSKECLNKANYEFHKYECEGLQTHFWSMDETDYSYIAFRMVMYAALHGFNTTMPHSSTYGCAKNNYPFLYNLKSHFNSMPQWKIYNILEASTKTLVYLICRTDFFKNFPSGNYVFNYVGGLLVKHHCQALFNSVLLRFPNLGEGYGFNRIGGMGKAICPTIALLNHSCSPNAVIIPYGDRIVVKTIRTVHENEEITVCYQEVNAFFDVEQRNLITTQLYNFKCFCSLCTHERTWESAPYKCLLCEKGKARKEKDLHLAYCEACDNYFQLPFDIEKAAEVCKRLYRKTYEIKHLLRVAEYYSQLFNRYSWMLLDVYKRLFEKYIHGGEKPTEIIKYGIAAFNILENYMPKLYKPLLEAKIGFYFIVIKNEYFLNLKTVGPDDRSLIILFSTQVQKTKQDLKFYVPRQFVDFYDDNLVRVLDKVRRQLGIAF